MERSRFGEMIAKYRPSGVRKCPGRREAHPACAVGRNIGDEP